MFIHDGIETNNFFWVNDPFWGLMLDIIVSNEFILADFRDVSLMYMSA